MPTVPGHPVFAAFYERLAAGLEASSIGAARRDLVGRASGVVVDLGAGIGLNLPHLGPDVEHVHLVEPDPHMLRRIGTLPDAATAHAAYAEALPLPDDSVDTVVSTLTLCTVTDLATSLREIRRVLRPGGQLLVLEHVRAPSAGRAWWQDRMRVPWGWAGGGCSPNRDTVAGLSAAGFDTSEVAMFQVPGAVLAWDWAVGRLVPDAA